jgi:hypothetical protein
MKTKYQKFKVALSRDDGKWELWTGEFYAKDGYTVESIEEHIKKCFSKECYKACKFGIFGCNQKNKVNGQNPENYKWEFIKGMKI